MNEADLEYTALLQRLAPLLGKGRSESITFLNWFLLSIYRLDDVDADDCICDASNDKGIDAIYVDENNEEIHFLQSKLRQKSTGTVGDKALKDLSASVKQFDTSAKVDVILAGNANQDLKNLILRVDVKGLVDKGYKLIGIFVTNEKLDADSEAYLKVDPTIRVYSRERISALHIADDQGEGVLGSFTFDVGYVEPMQMTVGDPNSSSSVYIFPAKASELVKLGGIADTSLFKKNVRYELGSTPVNRSIKQSIDQKTEHKNFVLFHNGIIILCESVNDQIAGQLTIANYSVVNGAQSITTFFKNAKSISDDLRVLVRVIALQNDALARKITEYSNNQNAIKPRDLRSNHPNMVRLQNEVEKSYPGYFFEIKRGEIIPAGRTCISNDIIGRSLLAFDVFEPWSSHQIYKVFDEKYAEIFGRREVDAVRLVFLDALHGAVVQSLTGIKIRPMASYALTTYFLLYLLSRVLRSNEASKEIVLNPSVLKEAQFAEFMQKCSMILTTLIVDLNYFAENSGLDFDYKSIFKSPKQCVDLADKIISSYEKDVARDKAESFANWVLK